MDSPATNRDLAVTNANFMDNTNTTTLANSFRSRNTAMTNDDLRKARESRAADALRMKDEQLRILTEQNANLLKSLDKLEEEANTIQLEKLSIEQENRGIRDTNFELQSKSRSAETLAKQLQRDVTDREKQLRIMTDQNSELLRLLESEESLAAQLQGEVSELRAELDELRQKHAALLSTAKIHEELATKAAKEGQLRAEEIRLLRVETEQLKQQNTELKMKTQVEVEALQEQLRVRKEKQYQLLEKLQAQEEAKRQAEDQVAGMEEQLRGLHARNVDLETQIKVEARGKNNVEEANKELQMENGNLFNANKELQLKIEKSEKERIRMEAEARDSGDQMREMADKTFQLLERLKLAELGKTKAMEALKKKEQDMVSLQKKNARLIKESTEEAKARVKAEMDVKVLQEQVRAIKKNNDTLAKKSKDEATSKLKYMEDCQQLEDKMKTMESRLSFLLNKVQADEEGRVIQAEDRKKLEAQVLMYSEKNEELQHKMTEMGESNRVITQALRLKQEELNEVTAKYDHLVKETHMLRDSNKDDGNDGGEDMNGARPGGPDDIDNVRLNEGRGRFYVEAKSIGGGSLLVLRARKPLYREWLEKHGVNDFLKRSQKTTRFRDLVVEKFAAVYGLLMVEEEDKNKVNELLVEKDNQMDHMQKKMVYVQDTLAVEEDAKRRMLLRYIHAVKEHAMSVNGGTGGVLQLPESNITDEEIHALAALLRNNTSIDELNLRGNSITDDGARALGAVLAGRSGLRLVDLRGNKIGKGAIRILAEALERSERVRHVYVHAGGKIEALGTATRWANPRGAAAGVEDDENSESANKASTVETVCVVDIRDNNPESTSFPYELDRIEENEENKNNGGKFHPLQLLDKSGIPTKEALSSSFSGPKTDPFMGAKKKSSGSLKVGIKKVRASFNAAKEADAAITEAEKRKAKIKAHEEKLLAVRESSWQGRSAGLDISADFDVANHLMMGQTTTSTKSKNKKHLQRGELPPLEHSANNMIENRNDESPMRGHSAPNLNGNVPAPIVVNSPSELLLMSAETPYMGDPEGLMIASRSQQAVDAAGIPKKKTKKLKKSSTVEKSIQNSPFGQPVAPSNF